MLGVQHGSGHANVLRLLKLPVLPLVLGLVLGYLVESNYRRSLVISGGELSIFVTDKVSLALLLLAVLLTAYTLWKEFAAPRSKLAAAAADTASNPSNKPP